MITKIRFYAITLALSLCFAGCAQNADQSAETKSAAPPTTQTTTQSASAHVPTQTESPTPTNTPFPDDSDSRKLLEDLPDYWGDWIPYDESVYIYGVKQFGMVAYEIRRSPEEMKKYFEQKLDGSEWGDGVWSEKEQGFSYELSKHNPRMKLTFAIEKFEGGARVIVFQEYREKDGY